jgi:hypothetical protein
MKKKDAIERIPGRWDRQERLAAFARLDKLARIYSDPVGVLNEMNEFISKMKELQKGHDAALKRKDDDEMTRIAVEKYRLISQHLPFEPRRYVGWKEFVFYQMASRLVMEAEVGPDATLRKYDKELCERHAAIYEKHGWPHEDEEGDPWSPEDHLSEDEIPDDYKA